MATNFNKFDLENLRIKQGEREPKLDLETIVLRYRGQIEQMAKSMAQPGVDEEELLSEAFLGLVEEFDDISEKVDPEEDLSDVVISACRLRMMTFLMKQSISRIRMENFLRLHHLLKLTPMNSLDKELSVEELHLQQELWEMLERLLNTLPERYSEVVLMKLLDERSFSEIAAVINKLSPSSQQTGVVGISDTRISQIFNKAMRLLTQRIKVWMHPVYGRENDPYDLGGRFKFKAD